MNIVHEHCSQNFFEKKKIKSNQIFQNEIFKNEIFVVKNDSIK